MVWKNVFEPLDLKMCIKIDKKNIQSSNIEALPLSKC